MASKWRKAKAVLGMNLCVYTPMSRDDDASPSEGAPSDANAVASSATGRSVSRHSAPMTPTPSSSGLRLSKSSSKSSKKTCAICLGNMKPGNGQALFTAECSHTFHFHCIASNVKHGNQICPVCRAKWKEIPFQISAPCSDLVVGRPSRVSPVNWSDEDNHIRRLPRAPSYNRPRGFSALFLVPEPGSFDDDEHLDPQPEPAKGTEEESFKTISLKTVPEFSAVHWSASEESFTVLINLKAPISSPRPNQPAVTFIDSQASRAPVDLVTVLDVSGSMAGTKLALLKRAMGFVIQNLGPSDRLSVVAFSSTARRLFHLRRMSETGRLQALQAVNGLTSSGGTNIAEGLRKASKVIEDRREKNPVCSIILLSDGQDTYTVTTGSGGTKQSLPDYGSLLPPSICRGSGHHIPVHAFGFGSDHDSAAMHSISETSGGTFSFIETESVIQDAFAQCIGGLLSVVVQDLQFDLECVLQGVRIGSIKSGSYASRIVEDGRKGSVDVGDLYADEERDFLVSVNVPVAARPNEDSVLMKVHCGYRDPVSKEGVNLEVQDIKIRRPEVVITRSTSVEVDRQRNRVMAAEAMADARAAAERGALSEGVAILEVCRRTLLETAAWQVGDRLSIALNAELLEMQERMANRQRYEASGRAYVLSGLSSHSWQRATARGDSTDSTSLLTSYQTPSMVDMVLRSRQLGPANAGPPNPPVRASRTDPFL